jgi:hypothetical protein
LTPTVELKTGVPEQNVSPGGVSRNVMLPVGW